MQKINLSNYIKIFRVKGVKILNNLHGKSSTFFLPPDIVSYTEQKFDEVVSFEKFQVFFETKDDQDVFSVCVDEFLWISSDYKLTDNEDLKAFFGISVETKSGKKEYSSIHARVAAVYTALLEGKIRIGEVNKIED